MAKRKSAAFLVLLFCLVALQGCAPPDYTPLRAAQKWETYTDPELGYSVSYPAALTPSGGHGEDLLFRYDRSVPALVRFADAKDGARRGLWFGSDPSGEIELGGKPGFKYVYTHGDGPFSSETTAYVIEYRGKFLALEFRAVDELGPVVPRMLESFHLLPQ